jgi:hypothetical protein
MAATFILDPHAVFTGAQLVELLGLRTSTLRREIREKRLRVSKRAGRYYFLGTWVREWLEAGEISLKGAENVARESLGTAVQGSAGAHAAMG